MSFRSIFEQPWEDHRLDEMQRCAMEIASRFFEAKGFDNTKVRDVCKGLGISRLQFYRHFHSLDEVLDILWAR